MRKLSFPGFKSGPPSLPPVAPQKAVAKPPTVVQKPKVEEPLREVRDRLDGVAMEAATRVWEEQLRSQASPFPVKRVTPVVPTRTITADAVKTYLECRSAAHNKFYEITVRGSLLATRWGRIGTQGQTDEKRWPYDYTAKSERDKLIAKKLKKGYVVVRSGG